MASRMPGFCSMRTDSCSASSTTRASISSSSSRRSAGGRWRRSEFMAASCLESASRTDSSRLVCSPFSMTARNSAACEARLRDWVATEAISRSSALLQSVPDSSSSTSERMSALNWRSFSSNSSVSALACVTYRRRRAISLSVLSNTLDNHFMFVFFLFLKPGIHITDLVGQWWARVEVSRFRFL